MIASSKSKSEVRCSRQLGHDSAQLRLQDFQPVQFDLESRPVLCETIREQSTALGDVEPLLSLAIPSRSMCKLLNAASASKASVYALRAGAMVSNRCSGEVAPSTASSAACSWVTDLSTLAFAAARAARCSGVRSSVFAMCPSGPTMGPAGRSGVNRRSSLSPPAPPRSRRLLFHVRRVGRALRTERVGPDPRLRRVEGPTDLQQLRPCLGVAAPDRG